MAQKAKSPRHRMGKKHRSAETRPRKGRNPKLASDAAKAGKKANARKAAEKAAANPGSRPSSKAGARKSPARAALTPAADESDWQIIDPIDDARVSAVTEAADNAGLPLVAVCGRPNVGKSTLFNRLTHSRRSIVGDEPGITRDRIYGEIEWQGKRARLVDTGGVVPDDEALIPSEIFRQAQVALEEADAVVMVVDGRTELAAPDIELARLLQRGGKPIFLAVNKMDTESMEVQAEAFRRLGFRNVLPISAEHGSGIGDLLDDVFAVLPDPKPVEPEVLEAPPTDAEEKAAVAAPASSGSHVRTHGEYDQRETKVAIIGRPNVGKSTLLNALTNSSRAIVSPIAGTTRDAVDEIVERKGHIYRFVDTAGIRRKGKTKLMAEKLSVIMARKHLEAADVSLLIIDATEGVAALDANIGGYAHESGRSVIIVVNKWDAVTTNRTDGKPPLDKKLYEEQVRYALKYLDYAPLLFISALEKKNIDQVFAKTELVSRERRKRVSTGQMNKFLEKVDFQRASVPMAKRVRIFYMTQAAVAPPTFVLFTDKEVKLHFAFERFLANQIRESFGFIGSPIWFKIRARKKVTLAERTR